MSIINFGTREVSSNKWGEIMRESPVRFRADGWKLVGRDRLQYEKNTGYCATTFATATRILADQCLRKSKRQASGCKLPRVGSSLFKRHVLAMKDQSDDIKDQSDDIKDQSDVDSEVSGAETEVADAEVASPKLPIRPGILCRHSSCPEEDTNGRAWFFFHLI